MQSRGWWNDALHPHVGGDCSVALGAVHDVVDEDMRANPPDLSAGRPTAGSISISLLRSRLPICDRNKQSSPGRAQYAPLGNGDRFLFSALAEQDDPKGINVVLNWTVGLKK